MAKKKNTKKQAKKAMQQQLAPAQPLDFPDDISAKSETSSSSSTEHGNLRLEIESLKKELMEKTALLDMYAELLCTKNKEHEKALQEKDDKHAKEKKKLSARIEKLRPFLDDRIKVGTKLDYQVKETERLQERCHQLFNIYADQKTKKIYWVDSYARIEQEIEDLKEKHELQLIKQRPLVIIGVAIRKRFLEQARSVLPGRVYISEDEEVFESWGSPEKAVIDLGNAAAHFGNSEADAALFTYGYLEGREYEALFKAIYQLKPNPSRFYAPYLRKLRDCEATIRTMNVGTGNDGAAARVVELLNLARACNIVRIVEDDDPGKPSEHLDDVVRKAQQSAVNFVEKYRRR